MQLEIGDIDLDYADRRVCTRSRREGLVQSLLRGGQQVPVLVVRRQARHLLIDGYARVAALRELARDVVEAVLLETDEVDALVLRHRMKSTRPTPLEDGWLIEDLVDGHGLTLEQVARRLQKSKSWISRSLALVQILPKAAQNAVKKEIVSPQGARKYLVPLARANAAHCALLAENLGSDPVSVRELERLYLAWRRGDEQQRQRIVDNPHLFLKAAFELGAEPMAIDDAERLVGDLEGIAGLCRRGRKRLRDGVLVAAADTDQEAILGAWQEAQLAYASLASRIAEEERDDRVHHPRSDPGAGPEG